MNNKPLVSIIIPTYNRPNYVYRAVESALKQTYENIEVLVIDDNSPQSTERQLTKNVLSAVNDYRFRYIELAENSGGSFARNIGIKESRGSYINFLDDDDILLPYKIEKQMDIFLRSNIRLSVVGCFADIINAEGKIIRTEKERLRGDVYKQQLKKNICTTSIALIDKEVCLKSGGFVKMPSSQDHYFFIKVFEVNPFYDFVDEVLVNINHHGGPRVSTSSEKPAGSILLLNKIKPQLCKLSKKDRKEVEFALFNNVAMGYLSIGENKKARKQIILNIMQHKKVNLETLKYTFFSYIGLYRFYNMKGMLLKK